MWSAHLLDLPDLCLQTVATRLVLSTDHEDDVTRTAIALAASAKSCFTIAAFVAAFSDPYTDTERAIRGVAENVDTDEGSADMGLGTWKVKPRIDNARLKRACLVARVPRSGDRDKLLARLRKFWKLRGMRREFGRPGSTSSVCGMGLGFSERRLIAAKCSSKAAVAMKNTRLPQADELSKASVSR